MNILQSKERELAIGRGHVPSVPILTSSELKSLRLVFEKPERDAIRALLGRGMRISHREARQAFHSLDPNRLIEAGFLYEEQGGIRSHFQAQRYNGLIFFSDFFHWETDPEFVLPIGPAGRYLALLTIRRAVESAFDLGCGCGIQSLLAARHSRRVVATDINPRAVALTRLNAELNDIHNIETHQGSYFQPVMGQRFDLIVANLPYVITPEKHQVYRTADQAGDAGTHERLREIPHYLNEGGFAQLLINWFHETNQEPSEPIRRSIQKRNVDAWLIHNGSKPPDEYAEMWLKSAAQNDMQKIKKTKKDWMDWYSRHHIERIALGAVTLRRRSDTSNWFHSVTVNETLKEPAGEEILRSFAAQDVLKPQE